MSSTDVLNEIASEPSGVIDVCQLLDSVHDPVLIFDPHGEIVLDVNERACETYGLPRSRFIGMSLESISADSRGSEHVAATLRAPGHYSFETRQRRADGSEMVLEIHALPIEWNGRRAILSINRDVTERVRMLRRLEEAASEWQITVDAIHAALVLVDARGRILRANACASQEERVFNLVGRQLTDLTHHAAWERAAALAQSVFDTQQPASSQVRDLDDDTTWDVAVTLTTSPAYDAHAVVIIRDITQSVELEASLRRNENMAAVGRLVAGVAHEVRNPLFVISATVDALVARCPDTDEISRRLRWNLSHEIERLSFLMNDLLEYAKPRDLQMKADTLHYVLANACGSVNTHAAAHDIRIINAFPNSSPEVLVDHLRLVQVLHNLLHNAIHFTPVGGTVTIGGGEIEREGRRWIFCTVEDDGPGFAPQDLSAVFEPFFSRRSGGTGLGLSIVQRIVELHGGRVTASNREEGGARLTVELPALC